MDFLKQFYILQKTEKVAKKHQKQKSELKLKKFYRILIGNFGDFEVTKKFEKSRNRYKKLPISALYYWLQS